MTFMLLNNITGICLSAAGWAVLIARWSEPGMPHETYGFWALSATAFCVYDVVTSSTGWAVFQGSLAAYWAWKWWQGRRKGRMKRAAKELGAKSRARVEALVERLSPSPIPVPGGAS